jgi:uncharacterized protein
MLVSTAIVVTDAPARYAKQLLRHLSVKPTIELVAEKHRLVFEYGTATVRPDGEDLLLRAEAADAESLARLEDVLARQLVRFGRRNELTVQWQRGSDGG